MAFVSVSRSAEVERSSESFLPVAMQISKDLYEGLPVKQQQRFSRQPMLVNTNPIPFVKTASLTGSTYSKQSVVVSLGFLRLVNNLSHAKAIDRHAPGYFRQYIAQLANTTDEAVVPDLPNGSNPAYWSLTIINEKDGYFNQAIAGVLAVELAHDYPATATWERSLWSGIQNALECGYGTEGMQMLYDVIDTLPVRPAWAAHLLPESAQIPQVKYLLAKQERIFFHGR